MILNDPNHDDIDGDDLPDGSDFVFDALPPMFIDPATQCWIPIDRPTTPRGYVRVTIMGRPIRLHRLSFAMVNGGIRKGDVVRHTCDRRECFNPAHLIRGTHVDNVADRVSRGRSATGQANGRAKLTDEQAVAIYCDKTTPTSQKAAHYKVHFDTIKAIEEGRSYKKATAPYRTPPAPDASAN